MAATSIKSKHRGARLLPRRDLIPADALSKQFLRAKPADIAEILETLCTLGLAKRGKENGAY